MIQDFYKNSKLLNLAYHHLFCSHPLRQLVRPFQTHPASINYKQVYRTPIHLKALDKEIWRTRPAIWGQELLEELLVTQNTAD